MNEVQEINCKNAFLSFYMGILRNMMYLALSLHLSRHNGDESTQYMCLYNKTSKITMFDEQTYAFSTWNQLYVERYFGIEWSYLPFF